MNKQKHNARELIDYIIRFHQYNNIECNVENVGGGR